MPPPYAGTMDAAGAAALLELAEEARARSRRQDPAGNQPVEDRYPEMLEALDWHLASGQPDAAFRLASALVPFWIWSSRISDGHSWFERALEAPGGSEPARATALHDHGYLVFWAGRYDTARQRFTSALAAAERLGDTSLQGLALAGLARVALSTDPAEAVRLLRRAVEVTEGSPDNDPGRSGALHVLGVALQMSGDLAEARDVMASRLAMGRSSGDEFVVWVESANLSTVERKLGNLERAEELAREALRIVAARGAEMPIAWIVNGLAAVTAARGDAERAATLIGLAAASLERAGGEWPPDEREQYEETLATLAAALPPDVLTAAQARGAGLSINDGVSYASQRAD